MKTKNATFAMFLACLIFIAPANAKSPVWKISKNGNHAFVGGTIHVLSKADFPLPDAFDSAYNHSNLLVLEVDIQKLQTPEFQKIILQNTSYEGEKTIVDHLNPDTTEDLKIHLKKTGIPFEKILKLKPGLLSVTLTMVELQRLGLVGIGVDEFYLLKALNEKKDIQYLESALDQVEFIAEMGEGNENKFIKHTLIELKDISENIQALKTAWKAGDNNQMQEIALDPIMLRFPKIYESLIVERNDKWISKIEKMLKTKEVEFILFGTLHLMGKDGILSQLKNLGYTVENI